jgi:hypothetical protein
MRSEAWRPRDIVRKPEELRAEARVMQNSSEGEANDGDDGEKDGELS